LQQRATDPERNPRPKGIERSSPSETTERAGKSQGIGIMALLEMNAPNITEIGTPDGMFELGLMHCTGRDAALDLVTAHKWFNLAALQGNQDAKRYRMEIAREMSKAEIAEAQRQAREWLGRH
jgi:uncharacterized protein